MGHRVSAGSFLLFPPSLGCGITRLSIEPPYPVEPTVSDKRHLEQLLGQFEAAFKKVLPRESSGPTDLAAAMRYSALAGGKRFRPMLTLLAAEAAGGEASRALPAACALEMIHCYSLIHDDLPAMDDDDLRRGKPTNHKVYGEAMAILAGDALLTLAFETLAKVEPRELVPELVGLLAVAAGHAGMVGGQAADMTFEGTPVERKTLRYIHTHKTSDLIRCGLAMGGRIGSGTSGQVEALETFGGKIGLAFQVQDDILDEVSDAATMGKATGKDADRGKSTYPVLLGLEGARAYFARLLGQARKALGQGLGQAGEPLWRYVTGALKECPGSMKGPLVRTGGSAR